MNQTKLAIGLTIVVAALVLLSGSAVWATSEQSPLAQTVPTPTTQPPPPPRPWPWPWYPAYNPFWFPPAWGCPWGGMPVGGFPGYYPFAPMRVFYYSWGYGWPMYPMPWQQNWGYGPNWPQFPVGPVW